MSQQFNEKDLIVSFLSKVPPFRVLNREMLQEVARIVTAETYPAGYKIFSYGDPGDKLYIIVEGKVRVGRDIAGVGEEALDILGPGEYFGEISFIDEGQRSADAIVHEHCTLLSVSHADFEDLLMINQQLAYEILWELCRTLAARIRETNDKLAMLQFASKF